MLRIDTSNAFIACTGAPSTFDSGTPMPPFSVNNPIYLDNRWPTSEGYIGPLDMTFTLGSTLSNSA
jgi:hypothetical protein